MEAELFQMDGQTDMTKLIVAFSNFTKTLKAEHVTSRYCPIILIHVVLYSGV